MSLAALSKHFDNAQALQVWAELRDAVKQILNKSSKHLHFEELYRKAYHLVLNRYGEMCHTGLKEVINEHLVESTRVKLEKETASFDFAATLTQEWKSYYEAVLMLRDIFMYLERTEFKLESILTLGRRLFQQLVLEYEPIREKLNEFSMNSTDFDADAKLKCLIFQINDSN